MDSIKFAEFFSSTSDLSTVTEEANDGNDLCDLLYPLPPAQFVSTYFMKRAVYIGREDRTKLDFMTLERFRALLNSEKRHPTAGFSLHAQFRSSSRDHLFAIEPHQVGHLLDAGATICASRLHFVDPKLYRLTRALKVQLSFSGKVAVSCYVSPDGAGFPMHYDTKAGVVVQLSGQKRWRYGSTPAIAFPRRAARIASGDVEHEQAQAVPLESWEHIRAPAEAAFEEKLLQPGDVLCFPPGVWHEACAEGFSLALTISFQPLNFAAVLLTLLSGDLVSKDGWRQGPPALATLPPEQPPESVTSYFRARIGDLRDAIDRLDENDPRLWTAWYASLTETMQPTLPSPRTSAVCEYVRINRAVPFCHFVCNYEGEDRVIVQSGTKRITLSIRVLPLVRAFGGGETFRCDGADATERSSCTVPETKELWNILLSAGIAEYDRGSNVSA